MITALIQFRGDMEALAATLSALVAGVAEGLIADAVVLTAVADPDVEAVADAVGARVVVVGKAPCPWAVAAAVARRDWLLCLEAGDLLGEGWGDALDRFVAGTPGGERVGRLRRAPSLGRALVDSALGTRRVRAGDLVHRSLFGPQGLRKRLRPHGLAVRIKPAPLRRKA